MISLLNTFGTLRTLVILFIKLSTEFNPHSSAYTNTLPRSNSRPRNSFVLFA